jgi:branched-chain amino acid transport system permease protein
MRAAAMDFRTARLLGVRANRVIAGAVIVSGLFAAVAAIVLSVQQTQITSTFGLQETIYVLAGVVLGGLNRPVAATLGGFSIGFAIGILGGVLPYNQAQYLPSFVFAAVIVVLLLRPNGLFARGGAVERV